MDFPFNSNRIPLKLTITVETKSEQPIAFVAKDADLKNAYYYKRAKKIKGVEKIELKFPVSPINMVVSVFNANHGNLEKGQDRSFRIVDWELSSLNNCAITLTAREREFIKFASQFAQTCSIISCGSYQKPHAYFSDHGNFVIAYMDKITNSGGNKKLNTPSRIGSKSGIIEVSKQDFVGYTVPMRMMILCHEYGHVYRNPEKGIPMEDESGADINGLMIYLAMGYSEFEAVKAFTTVFAGNKTAANEKRLKIIIDFIEKVQRGEVFKLCSPVSSK
jgi:hypothetical protein